jgi:O-antigen ligase
VLVHEDWREAVRPPIERDPRAGTSVPVSADEAVRSWRDVRLGQWAVIALVFLIPTIWTSSAYNWFTTPKVALALIALGPGLVVLVWLAAAQRDRPALAAVAFLVAASASTLLAHEPLLSLVGEYFSQNGLVLTAACVSFWALGRTIDERARHMVVLALVAAAFVNAAVAWLQMSTGLGIQALAPYEGRAQGLTGNAVYLAALCAAALWLVASEARRSARPLAWWGTAALLAGAVELSGSRIALVLVVGVLIWHAVLDLRDRRRVRAGALIAAGLLGLMLAMAISSSGGASDRVSEQSSSGLGSRVALWHSGLTALEDRPLLGYGPGRFQAASSPHRTLEIAHYEGPDVLYSDAHNLIVEYAVSTGLVGISLLGLWVVLSARRCRGSLLGFCVVAVLIGLLEPQDISVTPLIALALGAAMLRAPNPQLRDAGRTAGRCALVCGAVLAAVGLMAGTALLVGDTHYAHANARRSQSELTAAEHWLPPWPQLPALHVELERVPGVSTTPAVLALQREVLRRDGEDPSSWYTMGSLRYLRQDYFGARAAYRHALERNPWSFFALAGSYRSSLALGDVPAARTWRSKLCQLSAQDCPPRSELSTASPAAGP